MIDDMNYGRNYVDTKRRAEDRDEWRKLLFCLKGRLLYPLTLSDGHSVTNRNYPGCIKKWDITSSFVHLSS